MGTAAPAPADNSAIGYPTYTGSDTPVPDLPTDFTVNGTMREMYQADLASGDGTSFWMDRMLARHGADPSGDWLFTRGRAVFMKEHDASELGFGGDVAYWESIDGRDAYTVELAVDGTTVTLNEDVDARLQTPSYWRSEFTADGLDLRVVQTKYITDANVAVTNLEIRNPGTTGLDVAVRAASPYTTEPEGAELTGTVPARNDLTTVFPRFSGDGLEPADGALTGTVTVPAGGSARTKVQLGFVTEEIPESRTAYDTVRAAAPRDAYRDHVQEYNRWWAENLPYIDIPDDNIEKTLYYRWWLLRYNFLDANIPGQDYQFPTSMEGVLGYNNAIVLTIGMFVDDLKYLRNPIYSYGPWVSAGETSRNTKYTDNPGDPENWSNSYTQYLSESAWQSYQVHGGPTEIVRNLARYAEKDVKGQLEHYDTDGNSLIEYDWGAMTGNDADAVSFDWRPGNLDRAESAYVYSNAKAAADAYETLGDTAKADEMRAIAQRVRDAVLEHLWDPEDKLVKHRHVESGDLVPWKEINNYYPYAVGLMPKPDEDPQYLEALRLWADAGEYPIFPFYTANQADKAEAAEQGHPGSNNFSVINSTVTFRFLSSVLRDYPNQYIGNEWYKKLLSWNAWAHYVDGDNRWPDQNEFWADGSADPQNIGYRSWIHHTILGTTNWTVIEDAMGFRPRSDDKVELSPIDIDWPHFTVTDINYHGTDLSITWDEPGDGERPYGESVPEGYSVYLDGEHAFTVDTLTHLVYDPATGEVTFPDGGDARVLSSTTATLAAADEVGFGDDSRVVDMFAKAGRDITAAGSGPNLAADATASASFSAEGRGPGGAVDGFTINEPFWGSQGSPNPADTFQLDFGEPTTVDDVRLHFYSDKSDGGYAEPAMYTVQYLDGDTWRDVAGQVKSPSYPRANRNRVRFPAVTTQKLRVRMTHRPAHATGLTEFQAFATAADAPAGENKAPYVRAWQDSGGSGAGRARLTGIVEDDALPAGELSSTWQVAGAPEGATVVFDDPSAATTVARFTEPGTYTLELRASDGELDSAEQVVVEVDGGDGGVNVAGDATASASYTADWNSVDAVNNGRGTNSGGDQAEVWATWSGERPASQWLQYTWPEPVRVSGSEMMFWTDTAAGTGDGVAVPESWSVQYWDGSAEAWTDLPNPSGYGTARTGTNTTTFDPVTTTRLRATFDAAPNADGTSYSAVGVSEWEILAEQPVDVAAVHTPTLEGELPDLPSTVTLEYADGSTARSSVSWASVEPGQVAEGGTSFTVSGIAEDTTLPVEATVWVRVTDAVEITSVADVSVRTRVGVAPSLPATVVATYNDGSKDSRIPVTWDAVEPAQYVAPGEFTVGGTVDGTGIRARATVTVAENPGADACPGGHSADESIAFGDDDSGVPNHDRGDGCTFLDLVDQQRPFDDHGAFVRTVRDLVEAWRAEELFTRQEAQQVLAAAARSDVAR
ncbi:Ig-like domain-containing protein [Haloactinopolyspora alba]|nr:Ig-like domain-containing protein [Haloactinopolyspora alba]